MLKVLDGMLYPAQGLAWKDGEGPRRELVWGEKEGYDFLATYNTGNGLVALVVRLTERERCYAITHRTIEGYNWLDDLYGEP